MATPGYGAAVSVGGTPVGYVTAWQGVALEPPEVVAFWKAIGERPDDQLPRLVFADWLDEREEKVRCGCVGGPMAWDVDTGEPLAFCLTCHGTGYVSNGYADLAAALRATADRVPYPKTLRSDVFWWHWCEDEDYRPVNWVPKNVFRRLTGFHNGDMTDYLTAEDAIRDLCAAWCKANGKGVVA